MRVAELEGALLDFWVGKSEGFQSEYNEYEPENGALAFDERIGVQVRAMGRDNRLCWVRYKPSTDWAQGGPIIEREGITVIEGHWGIAFRACVCFCYDFDLNDWIDGDTYLIAAMRAYVASKFGDEVSVDTKILDR